APLSLRYRLSLRSSRAMVKPEGERILQTEPIPGRDEIIDFAQAATLLAELGRTLYNRGWVLGTSGNFSVVLTQNPLRLAITPTGPEQALRSKFATATDV